MIYSLRLLRVNQLCVAKMQSDYIINVCMLCVQAVGLVRTIILDLKENQGVMAGRKTMTKINVKKSVMRPTWQQYPKKNS